MFLASKIGRSDAITKVVSTFAPGEVMKTGTNAQAAGMYVSECCGVETDFAEQQTFTRCPTCSGLTIWEMLEVDDFVHAA
jgi:hypothetical protein